MGGGAAGIQGDVAEPADLDRLYEVVREEASIVDILVANAGGDGFMPLGEITEEHFDRTFCANVRGTLFTVQKALPLLRDGGSIILMGSTAATMGTPAFSVYSASKAAVRSFARSWILDLAARRIRVNVPAPGGTSTPGWQGLAGSEQMKQEMLRQTAAVTPLGRIGQPDETAAAALFLASDDSSYVTGSELFVDGGSAQI